MSEVENFDISIIQDPIVCCRREDGSFILYNMATKEKWPITKAEMLHLVEGIESWFKAISEESK